MDSPNEAIRYRAIWLLERFLNLPYHWGGDDPLEGFDCSGLVVEVLKAVGILGPKEDLSAAGLYERFMEKSLFGPGRLVFWRNKKGGISHVEMMLDERFVVGASGGDEKVIDEEKAAERNAYVKMRPVDYRGPVFAVRDPFKRG